MKVAITYKLLYKLFVLAALSFCLWAVSARTESPQQTDQFLPVVITEQLEPRNGVIPVEILCGMARLGARNQLDEFQCILKNNTARNITAANVIYSAVLDQNGSLTRDAVSSTVEALVHPDFRGTSKLIGPGDETSVGPPGPVTYGNFAIKGIEIAIDYVEFDDGTILGPDRRGSQIVKSMRAGAAKYRDWLKTQYKHGGKSVADVISVMEKDEALPVELRLDNQNEEQGANAYRNRFLKLFQARGKDEIKKLLDSN